MSTDFPSIRTAGVDGIVVSFGDTLSETANRAALAFRAALEAAGLDGVEETTTSLVSAYLRFDPLTVDRASTVSAVEDLLSARDWYGADLPEGRMLWRIPTVFGGDFGPQLEETAQAAGVSTSEAIDEIAAQRLRVQTIGFAPGQPYLGALPDRWDLPRQTALTDKVPMGAVTLAIRQITVFSTSAPTGWRWIGRIALPQFQPEREPPTILRPGDEVQFEPVAAERFEDLTNKSMGGATSEVIA